MNQVKVQQLPLSNRLAHSNIATCLNVKKKLHTQRKQEFPAVHTRAIYLTIRSPSDPKYQFPAANAKHCGSLWVWRILKPRA